MSQLARRDIHSNPYSCGSLPVEPAVVIAFSQETPLPLKLSICRNEKKKKKKMEAGCFRAVDMDEATGDRPCGAMDSGALGPRVFSRPETSATPPLFEEPNWSSCGQEEASKLYRETERTRGDLISVV